MVHLQMCSRSGAQLSLPYERSPPGTKSVFHRPCLLQLAVALEERKLHRWRSDASPKDGLQPEDGAVPEGPADG